MLRRAKSYGPGSKFLELPVWVCGSGARGEGFWGLGIEGFWGLGIRLEASGFRVYGLGLGV